MRWFWVTISAMCMVFAVILAWDGSWMSLAAWTASSVCFLLSMTENKSQPDAK